jgi:hypothetical protein
MFYRPDMMSITVCMLGIYIIQNPAQIARRHFRMLVLFSFVSFVYDLVFLLFLHSSDADDESDAQLAVNVRRFAYFFAWVSFAFRPVVVLVLWKVSLNFRQHFRKGGV